MTLQNDPDRIRIHVYTVCWNEEQFLPFFLRHYSSFADRIVVYDNQSTDSTPDIVRSCPIAELRTFDTNGSFDDHANINIKNNSYKESCGEADYVIVVDSDELIYHPDLKRVLLQHKRDGITLPRTKGLDMVSWRFPTAEKDITELVRLGRESLEYSKRCIFDPSLDMNFEIGCHDCTPEGNVVENKEAELFMLHYHYLGLMRCINRHRIVRSRLAKAKNNKVAYQYRWGASKLVGRFVGYRLDSHDVIRNRRSYLSTTFGPPVKWLKSMYWRIGSR